ncbi:MAG: hypothetical protein KBD63_02235, partial [Bacteriovoracaceae bacterium]|nr:hypothetical protein [Bacteriovoracaceae bacterium]
GKSDLDYYASVPLKAIVTIPPDISFEKVFIQVKDVETSQIGTIEVTPWWFNADIFATFLSHQKFSLF